MSIEPKISPRSQMWRDPDATDVLRVYAMQVNVSYPKETRPARVLALLEKAYATHGEGIFVFPEYCLVNHYPDWKELVAQAETVPGPSTEGIMEFAKRCNSYVAVGLLEKSDDPERPYNAIAIFGPDGLVGSYHKCHLWRSGAEELIKNNEEFMLYTPGDELGIYEMYGYKVGVMVCADGTFPEVPRALALNGANIILYPNGRNVVGQEAEVACKSNLVPMVVSNLFGDNGFIGGGSSRVIGPWGETLASAVGEGYTPLGVARGEGWGVAELDMKRISKLCERYAERTVRRPEMYGILVDKK